MENDDEHLGELTRQDAKRYLREIGQEFNQAQTICYLKASYLEKLTTWESMSSEAMRSDHLGDCINCTDYDLDSKKSCYHSDAKCILEGI